MMLPSGVHFLHRALDQADAMGDANVSQWLQPSEIQQLQRFHDVHRRRQWLAARRAAKDLVITVVGASQHQVKPQQINPLHISPLQVNIVTRDQRGRGIRPLVTVAGEPLPGCLSLAHSDHSVVVGVSMGDQNRVGVDVAPRITSTERFRALWFSPCEREWLHEDPDTRTTKLWALKEAVYKAVHEGESWNPRQCEVTMIGDAIERVEYRGSTLRGLSVCTQEIAAQVFVAVHWNQSAADDVHANACDMNQGTSSVSTLNRAFASSRHRAEGVLACS